MVNGPSSILLGPFPILPIRIESALMCIGPLSLCMELPFICCDEESPCAGITCACIGCGSGSRYPYLRKASPKLFSFGNPMWHIVQLALYFRANAGIALLTRGD